MYRDITREKYDKCNFLQSTVHRLQDINFNLRQSVTKLSLWCISFVCIFVIFLTSSLSLALFYLSFKSRSMSALIRNAIASFFRKLTNVIKLFSLFFTCILATVMLLLHLFVVSFMFRHSFYFNFCCVYLFIYLLRFSCELWIIMCYQDGCTYIVDLCGRH